MLAPLIFVQPQCTPVVKVRPVVWLSDVMWQDADTTRLYCHPWRLTWCINRYHVCFRFWITIPLTAALSSLGLLFWHFFTIWFHVIVWCRQVRAIYYVQLWINWVSIIHRSFCKFLSPVLRSELFCVGKTITLTFSQQAGAIMFPVSQRGGNMLLYLCPLCLCILSHSFLPALSIVQAVKYKALTQCQANVGPLSMTLSQH